MIELISLKKKLEELTKKQQCEILKVLIRLEIVFSENANGIFFNLSSLSEEQLSEIKKYINYVTDQEDVLQQLEDVKEELSKTYFNNDKNSIKDNINVTINESI
jgi:hypothetical protein